MEGGQRGAVAGGVTGWRLEVARCKSYYLSMRRGKNGGEKIVMETSNGRDNEENLSRYRRARKLGLFSRFRVLEPRDPFMVVSVLHSGQGSRTSTIAVGGPEMLSFILAKRPLGSLRRAWPLVSTDSTAIVGSVVISVISVAMEVVETCLICVVSLSST